MTVFGLYVPAMKRGEVAAVCKTWLFAVQNSINVTLMFPFLNASFFVMIVLIYPTSFYASIAAWVWLYGVH